MNENKFCFILNSITSFLWVFNAILWGLTDQLEQMTAGISAGSIYLCLAVVYWDKYQKEQKNINISKSNIKRKKIRNKRL